MRCHAQWHIAPMGGRLGLISSEIKITAEMMGYEMTPELYDNICAIEVGAIEVMANQAKKRESKKDDR